MLVLDLNHVRCLFRVLHRYIFLRHVLTCFSIRSHNSMFRHLNRSPQNTQHAPICAHAHPGREGGGGSVTLLHFDFVAGNVETSEAADRAGNSALCTRDFMLEDDPLARWEGTPKYERISFALCSSVSFRVRLLCVMVGFHVFLFQNGTMSRRMSSTDFLLLRRGGFPPSRYFGCWLAGSG